MTTFLVTGAAGFIGSHIVEQLLSDGHSVIGVDDLSGGFMENVNPFVRQYHNTYQFYPYDVGNAKAMREIFLAQRPTVVVHCAANAREGASGFCPQHITYANTMISATLLELAIQHGMQRFIYFSSMSVYGMGNNKPPFDEKFPRKPVDPYGVMKAATETMIELLADLHKFSYVILRPHNVFGERQSMQDPYRNAVAIFANRILRGEPIYIYGKGHKRAFSYIGDSLPCFMRAIYGSLSGEIINVGGREEVTIDEMAQVVIAEFPDKKVEIIHTDPRHAEVPYAYSTYEKSEKLLGYTENIGWLDGIKLMMGWCKEQGPKEWRASPLPLINEHAPLAWRELATLKGSN